MDGTTSWRLPEPEAGLSMGLWACPLGPEEACAFICFWVRPGPPAVNCPCRSSGPVAWGDECCWRERFGLALVWGGPGCAVSLVRGRNPCSCRLEAALSWLPWAPAHLAGAKLAFSPQWLRCICWRSVSPLCDKAMLSWGLLPVTVRWPCGVLGWVSSLPSEPLWSHASSRFL